MNLQKLYELDLARREIGAELEAVVPRDRGNPGASGQQAAE